MNTIHKTSGISVVLAVVGIIALTTPVMAVSQSSGTSSAQNGSTTQQSQQPAQTAQGTVSGKLDEAKKRICEQSSARIQNVFKNIDDRSQAQMNAMNKISARVQQFYANKGYQAANYDEIVAEVTRTQATAEAAIQASVQTASSFGCDMEDPKGTANQYKVNVRAQITAMKEYKNAINDLIVTVKSAANNANQNGGQG